MLPERRHSTGRRLAAAAGLACTSLVLSGCYLMQLAAGQMRISRDTRPIDKVIAEPGTPEWLRAKLQYVARVRQFAVDKLGLKNKGSFTGYVDLKRPYVAWNVFAAPEFSVEPVTWCFPIAGCVNYRGYFSESKAHTYAARLKKRGDDVYVAPVAAYSTLGHFRDPVLSSVMHYDDVDLAALVIHELAHQTVYIPGDSDVNEAFAVTVEAEGVRRWLAAEGRLDELGAYRQTRARLRQVTRLLIDTRARLATLYASQETRAQMLSGKQAAFGRLRADYAHLRAGWTGGVNFDPMMADGLNNARLAAISTYYQCVPGLERLLERLHGDLPAFYDAVRKLGQEPAAKRDVALCEAASAPGAAPEQRVAAVSAFQAQVARDDGPHGMRLHAQPGEAVDGADAVQGQ